MDISADTLQIIIALAAGIALSASCGFRVFIPPLIVSLASMAGFIQLQPDLAWLGTWQSALLFGTAAVLEIGAYYIPALDNLLDTISVPAATIAGTILTAALLGIDIPPAVRWILALIAGGGTALAVSSGAATARGASTVTTAGLANPVLSTGELVISAGLSIATLLVPLLGFVLALVAIYGIYRWRKNRAQTRSESSA